MKWELWDESWWYSNDLWGDSYIRAKVFVGGKSYVMIGYYHTITLQFGSAQEAKQELEEALG